MEGLGLCQLMLPHFWRDKEEQASILVDVLKQLPEPWYLWIAHHISITDTGPGFASELLYAFSARWAPDGRLLADWSGQQGGHGIGLLLIDWVARMHEGQVQIGNRTLGGAKVRIELPDESWNDTSVCGDWGRTQRRKDTNM